MYRRWLTRTESVVTMALATAVACALTITYAPHGFRVVATTAFAATVAMSSRALVHVAQLRRESRTTMASVATMTTWLWATQRQLHAVSECGRSIEVTLIELNELMDSRASARTDHAPVASCLEVPSMTVPCGRDVSLRSDGNIIRLGGSRLDDVSDLSDRGSAAGRLLGTVS